MRKKVTNNQSPESQNDDEKHGELIPGRQDEQA
jgi:hypothetical protein